MERVIYTADSRGFSDYGWLQANYSFSFARYFNPDRMGFGMLRVLNDDIVAAGKGFDMHKHENMEIITVALKGAMKHVDSAGHEQILRPGDFQVMSAGTGIFHSEANAEVDSETNSLQIWILPNEEDVEPRYDQKKISAEEREGRFAVAVAPFGQPGPLNVHQNAWISIGDFTPGAAANYKLHDASNGAYLFVIEGEVEIDGAQLSRRDSVGVWDAEEVPINVKTDSTLLLLEVPMI
ncbi:MAG: pirin family protein [Chloroflexota bacterium]